ncbi:MAG TPA: RNA polymerase-binding protein DksA [Candidatus Thiothrix moscowensis]|nr:MULTISPECIES: RNA polymerase-binding protein DksA [unclassified Thiothrix]HRJ52544.1 RNA polymerase-binding protein DksA [Candidatus Thiothrix moscowensis]HRJ94312.1 RNA polymerase-binding protein DksA [Candidatus Thiothrix moscowensis]
MTEAELLAMPPDDYMNAQQLAFFHQRLLDMRQEILNRGEETMQSLRESELLPDPADQATLEEEHVLELRTRDRERKLLKKINEALERLDSGNYGYCEETGEPIGLLRLLARPTATLSLEAQAYREIQQRQFAG